MRLKDNNNLVFTPYITLKNGKRIYASAFGKKAFCFPKGEKKQKTKQYYCDLNIWLRIGDVLSRFLCIYNDALSLKRQKASAHYAYQV